MNYKKPLRLFSLLILPFIVSCGETPASSVTPATTAQTTTAEATTVEQTTVDQTTVDVTTVEESTGGETTVDESTGGETTVDESTGEETTVEESTGGETTVEDSTADTSVPFLMEAEYTDLDDKSGAGYSGGADGWGMIGEDIYDAGASNGYYVTYLYVNKLSLDFEFESDKDVSSADLTLRLTSEIKDVVLTTDIYAVTVNDVPLSFRQIDLLGASTSDSDEYMRPFTNHAMPKISLKKGKNVIKMITQNNEGMGGTMYATAPVVDCITISNYGDASLSWEPRTDNLEHFE